MIYKNHKIEAEVSQYLTFALTEDGRPDPTQVTSEDGWDVTGYYCQNQNNKDDECWYAGKTLEEVKELIDRKVQ